MNDAARDGRRRRRDAAPLIQLVCNFLFVETRLITFSSDDFVGLPIFFTSSLSDTMILKVRHMMR